VGLYNGVSKVRGAIFDTLSESERHGSDYVPGVARARKDLDLAKVAEVLADPARDRPSMAEIARGLGVAKPTLYRMAGNREELVALTIEAEAERLLERIHGAGLPGFFDFASSSPAGLLLLFDGSHREARQAVRRVETRLASTLPDEAADPHAAAAGLLALAAGVARRALEDAVPVRPERLRSDFDAVANLAARISDLTS
jgi:AcrR family transcriptional regulator